jgi:hypothetical protein
MLGYELTGTKAKFLNFRHTGAPHIAADAIPRHLPRVGKMMDTSVVIVNRHYLQPEDDLMQEIIDGWAVPDVEVFAPDLEPVCADPARDNDDAPLLRPSRRPVEYVSEHRVQPLALALNARAPFAPCHAGRKCGCSARAPTATPPRS